MMTPLVPALGKAEAGGSEFETSKGCTVIPCPLKKSFTMLAFFPCLVAFSLLGLS